MHGQGLGSGGKAEGGEQWTGGGGAATGAWAGRAKEGRTAASLPAACTRMCRMRQVVGSWCADGRHAVRTCQVWPFGDTLSATYRYITPPQQAPSPLPLPLPSWPPARLRAGGSAARGWRCGLRPAHLPAAEAGVGWGSGNNGGRGSGHGGRHGSGHGRGHGRRSGGAVWPRVEYWNRTCRCARVVHVRASAGDQSPRRELRGEGSRGQVGARQRQQAQQILKMRGG